MRRAFEFADDDGNYVGRAMAAWSAELGEGWEIRMAHCTSGIVAVVVELEATEVDEDPTAGFVYCIERDDSWH